MNLFILFVLTDFKVDNKNLISKTAIAQSWAVYQIVILQGSTARYQGYENENVTVMSNVTG